MQNDLDPKGLLACPFCGCTDIRFDDNGHEEWLKCDWCGATGGFDPAPEYESMSLEWHWNRRLLSATVPDGEGELVDDEVVARAVTAWRNHKDDDYPFGAMRAALAASRLSQAGVRVTDEMVERAGKAMAKEIRNQDPEWAEDYDEGEYLIVSPSGDYFAIDVAARAALEAALGDTP